MEGKVMKKYFAIIALASLTLVACEKVQEFFDDSNDITTIYAIAGADRTKTTVSGLNVYWSTGDVVAVANEDGNMVEFELKSGAGSAEASFEGTLGGKELGTYAVYPATSNSAVEGNTVTVDYLDSWDYGQTILPMWGKRASEYSFYNVGGSILVTYSNVPTGNDKYFVLNCTSKNITGTVTVSGLPSSPAVNTSGLNGPAVSIENVPGNLSSLSFVIPVPAGSGYDIMADLYDDTTGDLVPGTHKEATNRTFQLNKITKFDDVDLTPIISVKSATELNVASTASSQTTYYDLLNVADGEKVSAATADASSWITNINATTAGQVTFNVAQQPQGGAARTGHITLSYSGAINKTITVNQDPAPVINVSTSPLYVYVAKGGQNGITINYTIENPTGESLSASEPTGITTNITTPNVVSFDVAANAGDARIGEIELSYPGANTVIFKVSQEGRVYTLSGSSASTTQADIDSRSIAWDRGVLSGNPWSCTTTKNQTTTVTIFSTASMQYNVTSFEVATGGSTTATINSTTISVYSNDSDASSGANAVSTASNNSITNTSGSDWINYYYRIEYVLQGHNGNKTKNFYFDSAVFYGYKLLP